MMASTVADNVSTGLAPLAANPSRNPLRLRARAPMMASAYSYDSCFANQSSSASMIMSWIERRRSRPGAGAPTASRRR